MTQANGSAATPIDRLIGWLRNRERGVLFGAVGFQVAVLMAMIAFKGITVLTGQTILLKVVPVDPRDLFRGDYVILGYEFSRPRFPIAGLAPSNQFRAGSQTVYVSVVPDSGGKHWQVGSISTQLPAGGIYLRGQLTPQGRIECGIESYFVQEGKGRQYEEAVRYGRLYAEIAVDRNGGAVVRGLHID
jgi:uncharacterized membrane-anchored protein